METLAAFVYIFLPGRWRLFIRPTHAGGGREYILLMAYVTDNTRFVACTFSCRRRARSLLSPAFAGSPCDENSNDSDKVSRERAPVDAARPFNVILQLAKITRRRWYAH